MLGRSQDDDRRTELIAIIQEVRRRWRLKMAVRGLAQWLLAAVVVLLIAAYALEAFKFSPSAIVAGRILTGLALVVLAGWLIGRPPWRRVNDEQVALYLEEHEPGFDAAMLSALDTSAAGADRRSAALTRRVIEAALDRVHTIQDGRRLERQPMRRYAAVAAGVLVAALAVFALGPAFLRHALSALFVIARSVEAAAPYRIEVSPGDATVPKGADQSVTAKLFGFDAAEAALVVRQTPDAAFERLSLLKRDDGGYEGMLFDLAGNVEYFVEAAGVRSPAFTLNVVELPYVKRLDLEYRFPAYTGLAPRTIEDGGDVAVLRGTEVRLRVTPTMVAAAGRLVMGDGTTRPLIASPDGTLTGNFTADQDGFYRIELDAASGQNVKASPEHTIDVLTDQAPTVTLSKPGRDTAATPVEEFFIEARADDDYAVRQLQLVYSINGGAEKTVPLFKGAQPLAEVTAGHTFYLEELGVQAGDALSYYARASDNDVVGGPKRATSDIYFLRIRPFGKEFKPATSMGGGGGGGGAGADVGGLSQQQRQIIAGTFNVQRNRASLTADKLREGLVVLALSQSRLREQVEGLIERMNSRLVAPDPAFQKIAELLPQAATEMKAAEAKLQARSPDAALPPEQRALQFLQQAEEEFELQVSTSRNAGGGGGAGSIAEDLADLFKMELDKMANQYETSERATEQNLDRQVDELAEKLRELARRQEQELERQRRMAARGHGSPGGGDQQRALAEQAEEAARQLERLSRDQNRPDLADTARRLREAADAMRRAAANGDPAAGSQAAAAAERLRQAQRQLEKLQTSRADRDVTDALRQAEGLVHEQRRIAEEVRGLDGAGSERRQRSQLIGQRKEQLESRVGELEQHLDRAAGELGRQEREASRKLQEAAGGIRDDKIKETIRYSRGLLRQGAQPGDLQPFEEEIGADLESLRKRLADAASAVGRGNSSDRMTDTLDKARELARGVESLGQRMAERARGDQGRDNRSGRTGDQPGQQGQDDRSGRPSGRPNGDQQGQQAQQGQQGQGGQAGQSGRAGEASAGGQQAGQGQQAGRGDGRGDTDGRWGDGSTEGPWGWGGGWGDRRPRRFTPDDVRQFRGEARRWTNETQELRRMLREQGIDARDLDEILRRLRQLEDERTYRDVQEIARLQTFVAENLKRFEYGLRRRAGADTDRVLLSGSSEVPAEFRRLVEEYYRSLSTQKPPR